MKVKRFVIHGFFIYLLLLLHPFLIAQNGEYAGKENAGYRSVPDSVADRMQNEKEFLYANDPAYWKKQERQEDSALIKWIEQFSRSPLLKWLLYLFLAFIIIVAIYQVMVVNDFFIFSRPGKKKIKEGLDEDTFPTGDLDIRISEAISGKQYRMAIRFMYLKTLQVLNDRSLIQLHAKSTNHDYIMQLKDHEDGAEFRTLTHIYEFVWYGGFQPAENQFEIIHNKFNQFISKN